MKSRIVIVASRFNETYVNGLVNSALAALKNQTVEVIRVPGAFEIPLAVQRAIRASKPQAVIALGVIWQGQTLHAEFLGRTVTDALMRISLERDTPVVHQILCVKSEAEARARCFGKKLNRGREAAETALALLKDN
ncbi:MAG: 6,7-dimethyl-8-ribityllumazine synthase [bacterium]